MSETNDMISQWKFETNAKYGVLFIAEIKHDSWVLTNVMSVW